MWSNERGSQRSRRRKWNKCSLLALITTIFFILFIKYKPGGYVARINLWTWQGRSVSGIRGQDAEPDDKNMESGLERTRSPQGDGGKTIFPTAQARWLKTSHAQIFSISLTMALLYVDDKTATIIDEGDPMNPAVQRLCKAVNFQSGASQARKAARADGFKIRTRSDFVSPETGCRIINTNPLWDAGGVGLVSLEISLNQEVLVLPLPPKNSTLTPYSTPVSYDRVRKCVLRGFSVGTGGRARFRQMLRNGDNVTSAGVGHFQSLEDLVIINKFSAPVVRPTGAPTISPTEGSTEFPTKRPVLFPSQRPSASDPSKGLTNNPNKTTSPILVDSVSLVDSDAYADPSLAKGDSLNQIGSVTDDDKTRGYNTISTTAIAAAAGVGFGCIVVGFLSMYRYRTEKTRQSKSSDQLPVALAVPSQLGGPRKRKWGSVPSHLCPPQDRPNGKGTAVHIGARRAPPIPAVVVSDTDGRSLAESTLGDRTAGRKGWSVPPPPVQFLKTNWVARDGMQAGDMGVSQTISSLDSGTIGGGDKTIGCFSLDAAIRDDDNERGIEAEEDDGGIIDSAKTRSEIKAVSVYDEVWEEGAKSSTVVVSEPIQPIKAASQSAEDDILAGEFLAQRTEVVCATLLHDASTLDRSEDTQIAQSPDSSMDHSTGTPDVCLHREISAPPDLTPKASGAGGMKNWIPPQHPTRQEEDESTGGRYPLPSALALADSNSKNSPNASPEAERSIGPQSQSNEGALCSNRDDTKGLDGAISVLDSTHGLDDTESTVNESTEDYADETLLSDTNPYLLSPTEETPEKHILTCDEIATLEGKPGLIRPPLTEDSKETCLVIEEASGSPPSHKNSSCVVEANSENLDRPKHGGPADVETSSASGHSYRSYLSVRSAPSLPIGAERSVGSRGSRLSRQYLGSVVDCSVASDLQRLEEQLKVLDAKEKGEFRSALSTTLSAAQQDSVSSISSPGGSSRWAATSTSTSVKMEKGEEVRARLQVTAPPGRLGIILANRSDCQGTVISALRPSSSLVGKVFPGDRLVAINGHDITTSEVEKVTGLMGMFSNVEKVLTVTTIAKLQESE